jgi:hypothetical protein
VDSAVSMYRALPSDALGEARQKLMAVGRVAAEVCPQHAPVSLGRDAYVHAVPAWRTENETWPIKAIETDRYPRQFARDYNGPAAQPPARQTAL